MNQQLTISLRTSPVEDTTSISVLIMQIFYSRLQRNRTARNNTCSTKLTVKLGRINARQSEFVNKSLRLAVDYLAQIKQTFQR